MDTLPIKKQSSDAIKKEYFRYTSPGFNRYLEEAAQEIQPEPFTLPISPVPRQQDLWILTAAVNRMALDVQPFPAVGKLEARPFKKSQEKYAKSIASLTKKQ